MKAKICSLSIAAVLALGSSPSTLAANAACSRFQPGHYFYLKHESGGVTNLRNKLSLGGKFKGVVYLMNWGTIEKSKGVYDFSQLDAALAAVGAKGMVLMLQFMDRTFQTGCNSNFLPSYVARERKATSASTCYAKIWETATADDMTRVLKAIAVKYKNDSRFLGISLEETAMRPTSFVSRADLLLVVYDQVKRVARAVKSVAPQLLVHQHLNWPYQANITHFNKIADNHVALAGAGGSVGWPDTLVANQYNWNWYNIGRSYRGKLVVMPHVQPTFIGTSLAEHDKIYRMLNDDIKAHMIVWNHWHSAMGGDYFTKVVIPTVNKYNGTVSNRTCPF
jgi:hypothetical protein